MSTSHDDANHRRCLLLAPAAHNLAEVTRMIEVGKQARHDFDVVFLSYDGTRRYFNLIRGEGFEVRELQPALDEDKIQRWWRIDRGEELGDMFRPEELEARILAELALYEELSPVAVLTGFCLSVPISARAARVPLVWVNQSTWMYEYVERFGCWPDAADYAILRVLPQRFLDWLGRRLAWIAYWPLNRGFNKVARRHGVRPFSGSELMEGDYNLFAEPDDFTEIDVPERLRNRCCFVGPIVARLPIDIPNEVKSIPRDQPIVYCAMGSSGVEDVVIDVIQAFADQPYRVIAPVAPLLRNRRVTPPLNVTVTDWLPAHLVNPMADVSVIHGGIGTVMTACLAGTPIVGIPNGNPEQEWNVDCIVRKGFAVHLKKRRLKPERVTAAVAAMLADEAMRSKARAFGEALKKWHGPRNAADFLARTFGDPLNPRFGVKGRV